MDRREFLVGAAAMAVAGPAVVGDGIALASMAHPVSLPALAAEDLTSLFASFPNGPIIKGWWEDGSGFHIKVLDWGEVFNEAPRSSEDQPS